MPKRKTIAELESLVEHWKAKHYEFVTAANKKETEQNENIGKLHNEIVHLKWQVGCVRRMWNTWTLINKGEGDEPYATSRGSD